MNYYDEDFKPWEIVDGQCVVADEAEWSKLLEWDCAQRQYESNFELVRHWVENKLAEAKDERPIVKVTTDIFEGVTGPIVATAGFYADDCLPLLKHEDLLYRTFHMFDATPRVDYLIVTQRPELVREKWIGCKRDHNKDGDCDRHKNGCPKSNVTLATYVETQSDIERLIPELLKCHDLCKRLEVVCNPKEKLDFREVNLGTSADNYFYVDSLAGDWVQEDVGDRENPPSTMCHDDGPSLNLIIAEGNEHPIHPQWVRCLRDQCLDAGVEFKEVSNE